MGLALNPMESSLTQGDANAESSGNADTTSAGSDTSTDTSGADSQAGSDTGGFDGGGFDGGGFDFQIILRQNRLAIESLTFLADSMQEFFELIQL